MNTLHPHFVAEVNRLNLHGHQLRLLPNAWSPKLAWITGPQTSMHPCAANEGSITSVLENLATDPIDDLQAHLCRVAHALELPGTWTLKPVAGGRCQLLRNSCLAGGCPLTAEAIELAMESYAVA